MGLGKLPGEDLIEVGCRAGPSSYTLGGFQIRVDVGELRKDEDVLGAYSKDPAYNVVVSGWSGNKVNVVPQYSRRIGGAFREVSAATDLSGVTFCATARGR